MSKDTTPPVRRPGLKTLRRAVDLTQAQLAWKLAVTEKTVRDWENAGAIPSLDKAVLLAKELRVSLKRIAQEFGLDVTGVPEDWGDEEY
jgi:DNA-binding XRE family transcriptional regulator